MASAQSGAPVSNRMHVPADRPARQHRKRAPRRREARRRRDQPRRRRPWPPHRVAGRGYGRDASRRCCLDAQARASQRRQGDHEHLHQRRHGADSAREELRVTCVSTVESPGLFAKTRYSFSHADELGSDAAQDDRVLEASRHQAHLRPLRKHCPRPVADGRDAPGGRRDGRRVQRCVARSERHRLPRRRRPGQGREPAGHHHHRAGCDL